LYPRFSFLSDIINFCSVLIAQLVNCWFFHIYIVNATIS
jgi:hypothetical protein